MKTKKLNYTPPQFQYEFSIMHPYKGVCGLHGMKQLDIVSIVGQPYNRVEKMESYEAIGIIPFIDEAKVGKIVA